MTNFAEKRPLIDHSERYTTKRILVPLLIFILIAFALRLSNIDAFSFWTDEALTPLRASYSIETILRNDIVIEGVVTKDTHPPLYYLIIHFTRQLFGGTDFAYRYPAVLAGVLLIPVMYQLGRRLYSPMLGLLVALLTVINPLQIWYADEARMYTLFVLLLACASYILWRALAGASLLRSLILYVIVAGLAFYTHYTAVFLIAFQGLFWLRLLWKNGQQKLIIASAVVAILVAIPLAPYTIPRLFSGAEANFFLVSPQTMLQDVVRFFALGVTVKYGEPMIQLFAMVGTILLLIGLYATRSWQTRFFLLSYLLAVVLGLMAGSYLLKPMYQGVRHIMAGSPAFILLAGWGLLFTWQQTRQQTAVRWLWVITWCVGGIVLFAGPMIALYNFYNHPEIYAKDDFRSLIAQMETLAGENDVIVYNNAIHLPLHEHYRTREDVAVVAVPYYPSMASETAVPDLLKLRENYDRIWFVPDSPADHRDDDALVRQWLNENLIQVGENHAHSLNAIVESLTFATNNAQIDALPENAQPLHIQWDGMPSLIGVQIDGGSPITTPVIWANLFWEGGAPPPNAVLRFSLLDEAKQSWIDPLQDVQTDKSIPWPAIQISQQPHQINLPLGIPPGKYTLSVQPIDSELVSPLGDAQVVAELEVNVDVDFAWPPAKQIQFENGLQLLGWEFSDNEVRPGHNVPLFLYWQTEQALPADGLRYELALIAADGSVLRTQTDTPGVEWLPTFPAHVPIREQTGIYIHPQTEPGRYQLRWKLFLDDDPVNGKSYLQPWLSEVIYLGELDVVPWPLQTELPTDVEPIDAAFGAINLHGYRVERTPDQLQLELVWQAQTDISENYALFAHFLDADNNIITQEDRIPGNTLRPTGGWREGEVILDNMTLSLPPEMMAGEYRLIVGFYDPERGVRLPAMLNGEPQLNDFVQLFTVDVP